VEYTLHSREKKLAVVNGRMVENLDIDVEKPMSAKKALAAALSYRNLTEDEVTDKAKLPKGELVLTRVDDNFNSKSFRFCYVFEMRLGKPRSNRKEDALEPAQVYIDAVSGEIVRTEALIHNCVDTHDPSSALMEFRQPARDYTGANQLFIGATFQPLFPNRNGTGPINFEVEGSQSNNWLAVPGTGLNTRYAVGDWQWWTGESLVGLWNRSNNTAIQNTLNWGINFRNATTAHWLMQRVLTFWNTRFLRNGINGGGWFPRVVVNVPPNDITGNLNASWDPAGAIAYTNAAATTPFITADVTAHEYGHAITTATCNLEYRGESGALNEALSDIYGVAFERFMHPDGTANAWNWLIAEDVLTLRDMRNPRDFGQPETYQGTNWQTVTSTGFC
jgi:bacillolysin